MVRRKAAGWALLAGAAAGGAALGYAAERRAMGANRPTEDPEWLELHHPIEGRDVEVESFDGTRLHAMVLGDEGAPTIVLAHGYGLGSPFWHYQLRDLRDYRLVVYDQRGHGRSERARSDRRRGGDYSTDALGRDLAAVIDVTVPAGDRVLAVGHSMGGMSVMAYAGQFPGSVDEHLVGAALISTGFSGLITGSAFSTGIAALGALEEVVGMRLVGRRLPGGSKTSDLSYLLTRAVGMSPDASPAHVAFVEQLLIDMPKEVKAAFAHTLGSLDLSAVLEHLTVPTLVLVGERDRLTPVRQSVALVDMLADADLRIVPGAGHHVPMEEHAQVTAAIREHAERVFATMQPRPGPKRRAG